jgi:hypothetical protein
MVLTEGEDMKQEACHQEKAIIFSLEQEDKEA